MPVGSRIQRDAKELLIVEFQGGDVPLRPTGSKVVRCGRGPLILMHIMPPPICCWMQIMMRRWSISILSFLGYSIVCAGVEPNADLMNVRQLLPPDQRQARWIEPLLANDHCTIWRARRHDPNWKGPGSQYIDRYYLQPTNSDAVQPMDYAPERWTDRLVWLFNDGTVVFARHGVEPWMLVSVQPSGTTTTQSLRGIRLNEANEDPCPIGACPDGMFLQPYALNTRQPIYFVPWGPTNGTVILTNPKRITDSALQVLSVHFTSSSDLSAFIETSGPRITQIQCFNSRSGTNGTLAVHGLWPLGFVSNRVLVCHSHDPEQIVSVDLISRGTATIDTSNLCALDWETSTQQGDHLWLRVCGTDDFVRPFLADMIDREHGDWSRSVRRATPKDVPVISDP